MKIDLISAELLQDHESIVVSMRLFKTTGAKAKRHKKTRCYVEIFGNGEMIVRGSETDIDKIYSLKLNKKGEATIKRGY